MKKLFILILLIGSVAVGYSQSGGSGSTFDNPFSKKELRQQRKAERKHKKMVRKHHKRVNKENTMIIDKKTYKRMRKTERVSKKRVNKNKPRTPWIKRIFKKKRY